MAMNNTSAPLLSSDRAEDLTGSQVLDLFTGASGDEQLVAKLMSPGTHLLQGCRGAGKTMLLRVAYERLRRDRPDALPVFVSFSRYLATYNAGSKVTPGFNPFQSWVLAKMMLAIRDEIQRRNSEVVPDQLLGSIPLDAFIRHLETHYADSSVGDPKASAAHLKVSEESLRNFTRLDTLQDRILAIIKSYNYSCVDFLLDEAAQSFAEELQPLFFSLVRHMRHTSIWIKASTYPHTTNYGRDFDVGHDAIILPVEREVENDDGMQFFHELIRLRFAGTPLGRTLERSQQQVELMIKASGGVPRWFIHILNAVGQTPQSTLDTNRVLAAIKEFPDITLWPFLQKIRGGLRAQRKFVDTAKELALVLIEQLREYNQVRRRPTPYVAISSNKTVPFRVHAGLGMLQYAGFLSSRGPRRLSRERDNGVLYMLHPAILIKENALFPTSGTPKTQDLLSALSSPPKDNFKEYTRNSPVLQQFHRQEEELMVCLSCGAVLAEGARFCSHCGVSVLNESPFDELLKRSVHELELTPGIKRRLIDDGRFSTIEHVVNATDAELDRIEYVGASRLQTIRYAVEEFLCG